MLSISFAPFLFYSYREREIHFTTAIRERKESRKVPKQHKLQCISPPPPKKVEKFSQKNRKQQVECIPSQELLKGCHSQSMQHLFSLTKVKHKSAELKAVTSVVCFDPFGSLPG